MSIASSTKEYLDDVSVNILSELWPILRGRRLRNDHYSILFDYLKRELTKQIRAPRLVKESDLQHIIGHLGLLKRNMDKPRNEMLDMLGAELEISTSLDVCRLTEFLTKAWLTIGIDISSPLSWSKAAPSGKNEQASLQQIIEHKFHHLVPPEGEMHDGTLNRLTMRYLVHKHGWTISWTSDLSEHLSVNEMAKVVKIYEHKICLLHHSESEGLHLCPIPPEVIKEALDTLNVLFPPGDLLTQRFLEDQGKSFHRLGCCNRDGYRYLSHYRYWHRGLSQLLRAMEEEPLGFKQFMLDKEHRNFREVTTFWLAVVIIFVLTLGFGIISTIFAAKSYKVAMMQYKLELAQACSVPGATVSLPHWCT